MSPVMQKIDYTYNVRSIWYSELFFSDVPFHVDNDKPTPLNILIIINSNMFCHSLSLHSVSERFGRRLENDYSYQQCLQAVPEYLSLTFRRIFGKIDVREKPSVSCKRSTAIHISSMKLWYLSDNKRAEIFQVSPLRKVIPH